MKISVIVPVFNREPFIGTALRSLLQHDVDMDILVIDDGSTDDTPAILRNMQAAHPIIRVISQPNAGVTAARNTGLRNLLPDTAFVSFLDSDDVSMDGRYQRDLEFFTADPYLELVYAQLMLVDHIDNATLQPMAQASTTVVHGISLTAATFRRSVIEKVGLFDEQFKQGEDLDYLLRIFELGTRYTLADHVAVLYRQHQGNMTNDKTQMRQGVMKAVLRSTQRRKQNPALCTSLPFKNITNLTMGLTPAKNAER